MNSSKIRSNTGIITAGFWFVFFLFAFFYLTAYLNIARINGKLNKITDIAFPTVETCDELIITLERANKLSREMLLEIDLKNIENLEKEFKNIIIKNKVARGKLFRLSARNRKLNTSMAESEKKIEEFINYAKTLFLKRKIILTNKGRINISAEIKLLDRKVETTTDSINKIISYADNILKKTDKGVKDSILTTHLIMLVLFIGSFIVGALITIWVINTISEAEKSKNSAYHEIDQIWNTASVGMCLVNRNYMIVRVNETFIKMFRLKGQNLVGEKYSHIWEMFKCHFSETLYDMIFNDKKNFEYEKVFTLGEGTELICLVKSTPFLSSTGTITGVLESFIDITEKKNLEKDIMSAIESERQRIGRDLHDSLGQKLTGLSYLNQAIRNSLRNGSYAVINEVEESIKIISELIDQTRTLSKGLHPVELDRFGLVMALHELALETERIFDISCEVRIRDKIIFDDPVIEVNLYYIVKEAVNNSIKHGNAGKIKIILQKEDGYIKLEIIDDGRGDDYSHPGNEGIGLRTMKFRASIIGADFKASGSKEGFKISVILKS